MLAVTFVLGFSVVFVSLGAGATYLGGLLLTYKYELGIVAGVIVTLFGLHMLGLTPFSVMNSEARFHLDVAGRPDAQRISSSALPSPSAGRLASARC